MPQSLSKLYAHLIFSTKNRQPLLDDAIRPRVHAYLATTIRNLDSPWVVVGGVADHVHILFDLGKRHAPVEFVEQAKRESSKFVKMLGAEHQDFYWQRGYGMFSVGPAHRDEAPGVRAKPGGTSSHQVISTRVSRAARSLWRSVR
jgi:putative transposase